MPIFLPTKESLRFMREKFLYVKETSAVVSIVLMSAQIFLLWKPGV